MNSVPESRHKGTGLFREVIDAPDKDEDSNVCYYCAGSIYHSMEACDKNREESKCSNNYTHPYRSNSGIPETRYDIN